jgi:hypothetical protein
MTRPAVAVFVKTPGRSPIKTRLAAAVGKANAEWFYRLCVAAAEAVSRSSGLIPYWAVAEESGLADPIWTSFDRVPQGPGELGERLDRVYRTLLGRHSAVLLIGADAPLLTYELLDVAAAAVQGTAPAPFALSRSIDGGYALFAGSRPLPSEVWTTTPYSCGQTADVFIERLRPYGSVAALPPINDVDSFDDLPRLISDAAGRSLLPEQAAVVAFAEQLLRLSGDD